MLFARKVQPRCPARRLYQHQRSTRAAGILGPVGGVVGQISAGPGALCQIVKFRLVKFWPRPGPPTLCQISLGRRALGPCQIFGRVRGRVKFWPGPGPPVSNFRASRHFRAHMCQILGEAPAPQCQILLPSHNSISPCSTTYLNIQFYYRIHSKPNTKVDHRLRTLLY